MTIYHKPVLINEVIQYLAPKPGKTYIDVTFGGGGHTKAILDSQPACNVIALDWDKLSIERNAPALQGQYGQRFKIIWGNFSQLHNLLKKEGINQVDGILADFGTSQFQIHHRAGFSFQKDSPLDMRMSPAHQSMTAANVLNQYPETELVRIFQNYGEEPMSKTIAKAIVTARKEKPFKTTGQLVDLIESLINPKAFKAKRGIHPATKVFQALRIEVNNELENIHSFLIAGMRLLAPGGRLVCISFHSLEDRKVKNFFKDHGHILETLTTKPIVGTDEEIAANPSSRSAKLRAAVKL